MKSFNLNIKNRIRIKLNAVSLLNNLCKTQLVVIFNLLKRIKHLLIILVVTQLKKLVTLGDEAIPNKLCNKLCKLWVCLANPSSESNTICYILEFIRSDCIEIVENSFLKNF